MIHAVGVGPGDQDLLTLKARKLLAEAELVIGFSTVLKVVNGFSEGKQIILTYQNQEEKLTEVAWMHRQGMRCVVCFMGDPNFSGHQLLERIQNACGESVEVVPGISSAQLAAARSGLGFEDVVFVTFHKRGDIDQDKDFLADALLLGRGAIVLPRPWDFMPKDIAQNLIQKGVNPDRNVSVYESLTGDEQNWEGTLGTLADEFSNLSVLVIYP